MSKKQDTLVAPLYCRDNEIEDFDSIGAPGYFSGLKTAPNAPSSEKPWIVAINIPSNNNWNYGNLIATNGSQLFTRPNIGEKKWGDWVEYAKKSDLAKIPTPAPAISSVESYLKSLDDEYTYIFRSPSGTNGNPTASSSALFIVNIINKGSDAVGFASSHAGTAFHVRLASGKLTYTQL